MADMSTLIRELSRRDWSETVAAHHRRHGGEVGRAAGRGVEDSRRLAEERRADDARSGDPDGLGIDSTGVVEVMDGAAGDEDRFAGSDVHLLPRDRPGQRALEPVDRLVVAVVAVGGSDLRARGDVELEDSDRPFRLLALDEESDRDRSDPDLFPCGHCHRRLPWQYLVK